jgi:hypothetical protein
MVQEPEVRTRDAGPIKKFYSLFNFVSPVEVLMLLPIYLFLRSRYISAANSPIRIFTHLLLIVAGVALNVFGNREVAILSCQHWWISPLSLGMQ